MNRQRRRPLLVALAALAAGVLLFVAATGIVRTHFGDVLVILFLVASLAAAGVGGPRGRLAGVGLFACAVECFQGLGLVAPDGPWWLRITLGSTFDPRDFLAYALGLGVAAIAEWAWRPARGPAAGGQPGLTASSPPPPAGTRACPPGGDRSPALPPPIR
jgi:hypothetical protein